MNIGIPTENKILEGRVGLIPQACKDLVLAGHKVFVQAGAGLLSGYTDDDYRTVGVNIVSTAEEVYQQAIMIIKVKEPFGDEIDLLEDRHLLFCFLHLAANQKLMTRLQETGLTAIAFETIEKEGKLPVLAPMSDIAGRVAAQIGAHLLYQPQGGRGVLLGGLPASDKGNVVILGAGVAGYGAALMSASMGANVTVFDRQADKLEHVRKLGENVTAILSHEDEIRRVIQQADLLIGAVLIPGAVTPHIVTADMVKTMPKRSVIIDISVDQGGCVETIHPTSYDDPTYIVDGVMHFGVTNMPGAVPRTASQALSASLLPFALKLATSDWMGDNVLR
ncbi:MAG: alanine dehydrogenase, partial [Gammaproteobacteria bacterium]|nr:alanine dehydrogenase [Gammaproteobacteria bacterium]